MIESKTTTTDPLKFYTIRIKELESMRDQSQSRTFRELVSQAIDKSKNSLQSVATIQKETTSYLARQKESFEKSMPLIDNEIQKLKQEIERVKLMEDETEADKNACITYLNSVLTEGFKTKSKKQMVFEGEVTAYPLVAQRFQQVLLHLIYKPNASSFNYDTIVDTIKVIAGLFIPGLDTLNTVNDTPLSSALRKKRYIASGDKIMVYIEKYIDVLDKWDTLYSHFIIILAS